MKNLTWQFNDDDVTMTSCCCHANAFQKFNNVRQLLYDTPLQSLVNTRTLVRVCHHRLIDGLLYRCTINADDSKRNNCSSKLLFAIKRFIVVI